MRLHAIAAGPGVILNLAKCVLDPTQIIEFLGFPVDSKCHLTTTRQDHQRPKQCCRMLSRKSASARELAQLIGILTSLNPAVLPAQFFYRNLKRMMTTLLNRSSSYDFCQTLTREAISNLQFWIHKLPSVHGRSIIMLNGLHG